MNDRPPPAKQNLDEGARIQLAQMREQIGAALVEFRADPTLRRAFAHIAGAIDDRLGQPRDVPPNRRTRRMR
jgi:hypothetical protein